MNEKYPVSKRRANALYNLLQWWIGQNDLESKEILSDSFYFSPPLHTDLDTLETWCYWHPQSADYWVSWLTQKKSKNGD